MKALSSKAPSDHLLLCVFLSLLWGVADSNTTPDTTLTATGTSLTEEPGTPVTEFTTPFTTPPAPPENVENVNISGQDENSITLTWFKVGDIPTYYLRCVSEAINKEEFITASQQETSVTHKVSSLAAGTKYNFTVITALGEVNSTGYSFEAVTAPENVKHVTITQDESSITLTWDKVNNASTYLLQYDDGSFKEENISGSDQEASVTHTVSSLTAGTRYSFTLLTVFEEVNSTGYTFNATTSPRNAVELQTVTQNETSITLRWEIVDGILSYILVFDEREIKVTASGGHEVTHTIPNLMSMTRYDFTLFTLFDNVRSSGVDHNAATAPPNANKVDTVTQDETSVTLQWNKVNGILNYELSFNGSEIIVNSSAGHELVTHTILGLTSGTQYSFRLYVLFANIRSSGVNHTAFTAPRNPDEFTSVAQNETSITLQWNKVDDHFNYRLLFNGNEINVSGIAGHEQVEYTILGLTSGTQYSFRLYVLFANIRSSGVNHTAFTAPLNPDEFASVAQNETSITLHWNKVGNLVNYRLLFNGSEINVSGIAGHEQVEYTILGLTSGTQYSFRLYVLFANIRSSGVNHTAFTAPLNPDEFASVAQNETSITLHWNKVGNLVNYRLLFNGSEINVSALAGHEQVEYTILGLTSGTNYTFSLFALFENVRSSGVNYPAATVPSMVASVSVTERSATSVTLTWDVDVRRDWTYFLQINGGILHVLPDQSKNVVSYSVGSLKPGTKYPFSVVTVFAGLNSTAHDGFTVTAIDCTTVQWRITNSSIHGTIEGLFTNATASNESQTHFTHDGGSNSVSFTGLYPGATYDVSLVYEEKSVSFPQCSHNLTIIPPILKSHCEYWAGGYSVSIVWNKPDGVWTGVEVNVTGNSEIVGEDVQQIRIPGFLPAKTYEVSVVSLSADERKSEPFIFSCPTDPRGVIAGSVFGVLLFCALICLVVFILRKRPDIIRKKQLIAGSKLSKMPCKTISVANFPDHFHHLSVDENLGFSQEYENLIPVGTEQTKKDALLPENKPRNRFSNVLPYDWCRVKLSTSNPDATSDYINASYMPGYNSSREYIATQGPLPNTINDFWRMIWEQRVKGIVMVANCMEGGRAKCEQYWPRDSGPVSYGQVVVTMRSEQEQLYWTLREFKLKHSSTLEERTVKHFHFTAWPDHGVPQGTEVLIQFRGLVRQHIVRDGDGAPTVVHCSAGVGRTGTIIALDVMLQQLERERAVGINTFVHKMRLNRPHMVQTESQYVFLHQCIVDRLQPYEKEENIYENEDMIYVNATALREFHSKA